MTEFKFTRDWFQDKKNQTTEKDLKVGNHFLLDLYPVYGNGENRFLLVPQKNIVVGLCRFYRWSNLLHGYAIFVLKDTLVQKSPLYLHNKLGILYEYFSRSNGRC